MLDHRRERHRQGAGRACDHPAQRAARAGRSWRSTAPPSPRPCWRASCSATRRARSPGPIAGASASSSSAAAGTILLDEIGDMPLALQAKILRVLQEQTFERVGGNETIKTDVRVIAATHRDLKARAAAGQVPRRPLLPPQRLHDRSAAAARARRRSGDPGAATTCAGSAASSAARSRDVAPEALARLRAYPWPGNIRELQSVLRQALLHASGTTLLSAFLPELRPRCDRSPRRRSAPRRRLRPRCLHARAARAGRQ